MLSPQVNIVKYKTREEKEFFHKLALQEKLYSKKGEGLYASYAFQSENVSGIPSCYYVAFFQNRAVGVIRKSAESTWIFVKPKLRKQGVAKTLINALEQDGNRFIPNWYGPKKSHGFFVKMGYKKPSKLFASNLY